MASQANLAHPYGKEAQDRKESQDRARPMPTCQIHGGASNGRANSIRDQAQLLQLAQAAREHPRQQAQAVGKQTEAPTGATQSQREVHMSDEKAQMSRLLQLQAKVDGEGEELVRRQAIKQAGALPRQADAKTLGQADANAIGLDQELAGKLQQANAITQARINSLRLTGEPTGHPFQLKLAEQQMQQATRHQPEAARLQTNAVRASGMKEDFETDTELAALMKTALEVNATRAAQMNATYREVYKHLQAKQAHAQAAQQGRSEQHLDQGQQNKAAMVAGGNGGTIHQTRALQVAQVLAAIRPNKATRQQDPATQIRAAAQNHTTAQQQAQQATEKTETQPATKKTEATRPHQPPSAAAAFLDHSSATRISTDTVIARALKAQYPSLELTIVPAYNCQLISYAAAGHATVETVTDKDVALSSLSWKLYAPPARRLDGGSGTLGEKPVFAKYLYRWSGHEFTVYFVDGRDGVGSYPVVQNYYILSSEPQEAERLVIAAGKWSDDLHGEIFVFDQGNWTKSAELYASVRDASWENVILDEAMKKAVIEDHLSFFRSRDTYTGLKVPWKRGIIYHGPPGNGKTISIKATMNMLYRQRPEIPTLYVRTLASWAGPEYSVRQIFAKARQFAPCYLVFEDLDTIVSDSVRSYFLNEVDGLKNNDGIFMVGSTNHLDRLDPGISKRPSRFDRKYYFPDPDFDQRIAYCKFWQKKLGDNGDIEFPDKLCKAIAEITDKFSFAYIQEAFVAALLAIARKSDSKGKGVVTGEDGSDEEGDHSWVGVDADDVNSGDDGDGDDEDDLDKYVLWVEIKKQVAILREGMDDKS